MRVFLVRALVNIVFRRLAGKSMRIEIGAAQGEEEDNKIENRLVANEESVEEASRGMRSARRLIGSAKHERQPAEKASRLLVRSGRLIIGLPGLPQRMQMEHWCTRAHARSRRYYVRSRIESKVVRESAGRPRRPPHGVAAEHVLAPRTRLIAVIVNPNEFPRRRGKNRRIRSWNAFRSRSTGPSLSFPPNIYARACRPYARTF